MKTILIRSIYLLLVSLLTGCSCSKKFDTEINLPMQNNSENQSLNIQIIDPFINSEIDFSQSPKYPTSTQSKNQTKLKNKKCTKNILTNNIAKKKTKKVNFKKHHQHSRLISYDSGLKYQILSSAPKDRPKPKKGQTVCTHYIGWQNDHGEPGELIDSTYERNLPFEFKIGENQVIRAWDEGLLDMRVGDKRRFFIPSELAWGKAGVTTLVPSNTDLIYEIEVLEIK